MKRKKILAIFIILILVGSLFVLNSEVTIRQGINYRVHFLKMPLYLKALDFYDRHFNYKWLVHKINEGLTTEEEKVMAIFRWTIENIIQQPQGLKVIDDHVWHIIVRGYGTADQFSDVFTTLCNYANLDAFFFVLPNKEKSSRIIISFVKIDNRWCIFDPYTGVYFKNKKDTFASVEDIVRGEWIETRLVDSYKPRLNYTEYFSEILSIDFKNVHKFSRANIQSPINRVIYGIINKK